MRRHTHLAVHAPVDALNVGIPIIWYFAEHQQQHMLLALHVGICHQVNAQLALCRSQESLVCANPHDIWEGVSTADPVCRAAARPSASQYRL